MSGGSVGVLGSQVPRILAVPEYSSSTGQEAVELAALAGLRMDPWQELVLRHALGEHPDGSWAAFEVGVEVPRQNGKGGLLEARELTGLFLLGERLIVHSAHEFSTAEEALERMAVIVESCPDFDRRVKVIKRSHGQEGIYLKGGQRLRYRTRTKGGGRGLSADLVILDEAMHIPEAMLNALFPTLSARENPQLWYTGSAVDQVTMPDGVVFARLRERALAGGDPALAYFGWSPPVNHPDEVTADMASDPVVWAGSNPALGIRITTGYVAAEQRSMSARGFAVERLGVGDWPRTGLDGGVLSVERWRALEDPASRPAGWVCLVYDVPPDRSHAVIALAGVRGDGADHVGVVARERGTSWVPGRLVELLGEFPDAPVACDASGPAGALLTDLEKVGVYPVPVSAREHAQAAGQFFDAVTADSPALWHTGGDELEAAVQGASIRSLGDAWAWSRRSASVDISPLVAVTLARWGRHALSGPVEPMAVWA